MTDQRQMHRTCDAKIDSGEKNVMSKITSTSHQRQRGAASYRRVLQLIRKDN